MDTETCKTSLTEIKLRAKEMVQLVKEPDELESDLQKSYGGRLTPTNCPLAMTHMLRHGHNINKFKFLIKKEI